MTTVPFYAQAEYYSHSDIERFKTWHPQAPRTIEENMLLLGTAGTGKSMVMRQLVAANEDSEEIYPLYIHAEDWLSETLAENALRTDYESTHFEGIRVKAAILLTLAIIERLESLDQQRLAAAVTQLFPSPFTDDSYDGLRDWVNDVWLELKAESRSKKWRVRYSAFSSLPDVLTFIGRQTDRILHRRLVLFIDQLDKVGPAYFEVLGSAFMRTTAYTVCLATRPSVCAPRATHFDARIGNNRQVWLGAKWDSQEWASFLVDATDQLFGEDTRATLRTFRQELARLVGPSTRQFMEIAKRLSGFLAAGEDASAALHRAVELEIGDYQGRLASCLVGVDTFSGLSRELNSRLTADMARDGGRRSIIELSPSEGLILKDETISRLRVLVREGFLVPRDASQYGVDNVGLEYRVIPQGISDPKADWIIPEVDEVCEVGESDFMSWSVPKFKRGKLTEENDMEPSVFYSHWMSDRNPASTKFLNALTDRLAPDSFVTTGKKERAHPSLRRQVTQRSNQNIADHIRKNIEIATAVVVQLDNPRPAIGIELGWSASFGRPLLLAYSSQSGFAEIPDWLKIDELNENGSPEGRERLIALIEEQLPGLAARKSPMYMRDGEGASTVGAYNRELAGSLIVGSGLDFANFARTAGDRAAHFGFERPGIIDTSTFRSGLIVPQIVSRARRAATIMAVLSGEREPDILTWLAVGAFSFKDSDLLRNVPGISGQRTLRRDFVLFSPSEWSINTEPASMVQGLAGYNRFSDDDDAINQYLQIQKALEGRLRP